MKAKVIEFFQNLPEAKHDQFNKAFELYRQSENKNIIVERNLNAQGFTPSSLDNLLYDLQKMHGITDVEKVSSLQVADSSLQMADSSEQIAELESEKEDLVFENEDLKDENEELKSEVESLKLAPKLDAKQIRVEFPFLNDKDCPDALKILVADKITAWNKYLAVHEYLLKIEAGEVQESDEEKAKLAALVIEYFNENQKIYDELITYQETGKILGVHPIFAKLQLEREVEAMTTDELVKYKGSSAKYFTDNKKHLAKAITNNDKDRVMEIESRVAEREVKLALVNKKLGIPVK